MILSILFSNPNRHVKQIKIGVDDSKFSNFNEEWVDLNINIESTNLANYSIVNAGTGYTDGNSQPILTLTKLDNTTVTANVDVADGKIIKVYLPESDGFVSCNVTPSGSNTTPAVINLQTLGDEEYNRYNLSQAIPGSSTIGSNNFFTGFLPDNDVEFVNVRNYRNYLLQQSDWTGLTDVSLTDAQKNSWKVYRQALRDLPEKNPNPYIVIWPTAPA